MSTTVVQSRNPDATRQAVLDAAEELFSRHGFAGTSMRELADAAGVSQPLIHHHFGSKEQLYSAVKHRVLQRYVERHRDAGSVGDRPVDIALEMQRVHAFLQDNETLLRLFAWARLEGDEGPWPGEPELMQALAHRIEVAQRQGIIRRDVDARNLAIMLLALVYYWLDNQGYYEDFFTTPQAQAAYLPQAIAVLIRGASPGCQSD